MFFCKNLLTLLTRLRAQFFMTGINAIESFPGIYFINNNGL